MSPQDCEDSDLRKKLFSKDFQRKLWRSVIGSIGDTTWWLKIVSGYLLLSRKIFLQRSSFSLSCLQNRKSFCFVIIFKKFHLIPLCYARSVFKLQSQHCCMEFFILWCLNMLIFQSHKASDPSLNGLKHHAWGWVYKINPFCCGYKSYIEALRKYLLCFFLLPTIEKTWVYMWL